MEEEHGVSEERQGAGWSDVKRRFEIEFFARTNGISKRQAAELFRKYGEKDYQTLEREARWLRE